jgi:hypothetical protein
MRIKSAPIFLSIFMSISGLAVADAPSVPPYDHLLCSNGGKYCAFLSQKEVQVFKIAPGNSNIDAEYSIPGWHQEAYISDDGRKFISIESLIIRDHQRDQPVLALWVAGVLKKRIYLDEILSGRKPRKTMTGYAWGQAIGFQGNDKFLLQLNDNTQLAIPISDK